MTDNAYNAKMFFRRLLDLDRKLRINLLEQEDLFNRAQGCGGITIGEKVQTTPAGGAMERAVAELITLKEEYEELFTEFLELRDKAVRIISEIDNDMYRNILRLRYCSFKRLAEISTELNYSLDYTKHRYYDALDAFGGILKDSTE